MASSSSCSSDADLKLHKDIESNIKNNELFVTVLNDVLTEYERIKKVENYLAKGADVNSKNEKGDTLLHIAIEKKLNSFIDFLLNSGANPYIKNANNETASDIAKDLKLNEKLQKYGESLKQSSTSSPTTIQSDEKLERFVIRFVNEFESKFENFYSILEGITKPKAGKFSENFAPKLGQFLGSFGGEAGGVLLGAVTEKLGEVVGESLYKKRVKRLTELIYYFNHHKDSFRNTLIEAGFQIFRNFEIVFMNVTSGKNWRAVINKLAEDASNRVINYIAIGDSIEEINENVITKGVIYGESKRNMSGMKDGFDIHYHISSCKNKDEKVKLKTAKIYSKAGIVDGTLTKYYRYRRSDFSKYIRPNKRNKYYYRFPFEWELVDLGGLLKDYFEEKNSLELQFKSMFECHNIEDLKNQVKSKISNENEQMTTHWMECSINELKCDLLNSFKKIVKKCSPTAYDDKLFLESIENAFKGLNIKNDINEIKSIIVEKSDEIKEAIHIDGNLTREEYIRQNEINMALHFQNFEELKKRFSNVSQQINNSEIWFQVLEPVPTYIDRNETELEEINELLNRSQDNDMCSRMVIISGLAGLGKSELARKYAKEYGKTYDNVIWLNCGSYESLKSSLLNLARKMQIDLTSDDMTIIVLANFIYENLCKKDRVSLFIFDNVEKLKLQPEDAGIFNFMPFSLPARLIKPHVIITTQRTDWDGQIKQIKLQPLKKEKAKCLMENVLCTHDNKKRNEQYQTECINKLVKKLGYIPLAIQLAASYIIQHNITVKKYFDEFEKMETDFINYELPEGCINNYNMTLSRTWSMAFDKLKNNEEEKSAIEVLYALAFLIPEKSVESMGPYIGENEDKTQSALQTLKRYSLLNDNLQMNSLMQKVIRCNLSATEQVEVLEKLLRNMKDKQEELQEKEEVLQHAAYVWNAATNYDIFIMKYYEFTTIFVKNGQNILHYACSQGHINVVRFLIENRIVDILKRDNAGKTVLHRASEAGRIEVVKYLTEQESDLIKVKDKYHATALYRANQQAGNIDVILHLLQKSIEDEEDEKKKDWWKFVAQAAKNNKIMVLKYLIHTSPIFELNKFEKELFLRKAAQDGELEVVKYLVDMGQANITSCSISQVTALHEAVFSGNKNVIQFILNKLKEKYAYNEEALMFYVNRPDISGDTPLMWAVQGGKIEAIKLLKQSGADVTIKNKKGETALDWWDIRREKMEDSNITDEVRNILLKNTHRFYMKSKGTDGASSHFQPDTK